MLKLALALVLTAGLAAPALAQDSDPCADTKSGEQCGPGNGRHSRGGGDKVSHAGWPAITGVLFTVLDDGDHHFVGGPANDEILGHHGDDTLAGGAGKDVLWGDWQAGNPASQTDVLRGGPGDDFLYPSHGKNTLLGGPGNDRIIAYYGHGRIDCGAGSNDYAQVRENGAYKVSNCERIRHFCQYGSKPNGDCKKPGEAASASGRRRA